MKQIAELIDEKKFSLATTILNEINSVDIANYLEEVESDKLFIIFRLLKTDVAAEVFSYLSTEKQQDIIEAISDKEITTIIDELFIDDTVDIIEAMPANVVKKILKSAKSEKRELINKFLDYPEKSAGSIMTPEYLDLKEGMTIEQSLARIRKIGEFKETINVCYVTDQTKKLVGVLSIKDLLLAQPETVIDDIMTKNIVSVNTHTTQEEASHTIRKYDLISLPVVDGENRIVGIITVDDMLDVIDDEATEDFEIMAAITPNDKPYMKTSVWKIWLNRVPWLLILMISATFTGLIINANEETLNMPIIGIILTGCIPMLMDTGGNAGSQASVTIIRGIALGEIKFKDILKVVWKELRVSLLLGITLSVVCFGKLMLIDKLFMVENGYLIAGVVCSTMFLTIVIAKIIGCTLPLIAKKCRLDPAVVASPFITTIVDAVSLMIYCGIAVSILGKIYAAF